MRRVALLGGLVLAYSADALLGAWGKSRWPAWWRFAVKHPGKGRLGRSQGSAIAMPSTEETKPGPRPGRARTSAGHSPFVLLSVS